MGTLLTAANWPIIGEIAWVLGKVMNLIYNTLDNMLPSDHGLIVDYHLYNYRVYTYASAYSETAKDVKDDGFDESRAAGYPEEI